MYLCLQIYSNICNDVKGTTVRLIKSIHNFSFLNLLSFWHSCFDKLFKSKLGIFMFWLKEVRSMLNDHCKCNLFLTSNTYKWCKILNVFRISTVRNIIFSCICHPDNCFVSLYNGNCENKDQVRVIRMSYPKEN